MPKPLRLLLVEDSERDAALLGLYLRRGGYEAVMERVQTAEALEQKLSSASWDVIVCDFNLPGFDAYAALEVVKKSGRSIPVIVVSGEIAPDVIQGVIAAGARHYLPKYELKQIVPVIERALAGEGAS